ncbi:hypothetical protein LDENG_00109240 [Lucifuga dentata]|nr:hypothetical protein LDENG_00109240 [Lucifuga dentata]
MLPIASLPDKQVTGQRPLRGGLHQEEDGAAAGLDEPDVSSFLRATSSSSSSPAETRRQEWKMGKRRVEQDQVVGPIIFSLIQPEAPELEPGEVRGNTDRCTHNCWKNIRGDCRQQQPQKDLQFLMETNSEYKSLLGCFPEIIAVHKLHAAAEKVKESEKLVCAGKINNAEKRSMKQRISCMSYTLQAEMNHFHSNRIYDYNRVMQLYLQKQVEFHQQDCLQLCRSDLTAETPVFPGEAHLQPPLPSDLDSPPPLSLSPSSSSSSLSSSSSPQTKRSYSMQHFRWGKPVGRKRRPVKVYTSNGVEEESAEVYPEEMRRRELENELGGMILEEEEEEEEEEQQEEEKQQQLLPQKKDGSYKMKHFRWSGPPASKRYGGFMKSWDERSQKPLLTLFKNVINKDGQQQERRP